MTFCTYIFVVIQAIFTILTLLNRELGEEWNGVELALLSTKESSQHYYDKMAKFTGIYVHFSVPLFGL